MIDYIVYAKNRYIYSGSVLRWLQMETNDKMSYQIVDNQRGIN